MGAVMVIKAQRAAIRTDLRIYWRRLKIRTQQTCAKRESGAIVGWIIRKACESR